MVENRRCSVLYVSYVSCKLILHFDGIVRYSYISNPLFSLFLNCAASVNWLNQSFYPIRRYYQWIYSCCWRALNFWTVDPISFSWNVNVSYEDLASWFKGSLTDFWRYWWSWRAIWKISYENLDEKPSVLQNPRKIPNVFPWESRQSPEGIRYFTCSFLNSLLKPCWNLLEFLSRLFSKSSLPS